MNPEEEEAEEEAEEGETEQVIITMRDKRETFETKLQRGIRLV